ncbi:MAG: hypothetical protein HYS17_01500 [Micavibrio aeruginosavorus]|uniref:Uncharacterized protein n=1 Tax=Micavibrio aeruginosavorus TaxID=349221 RepID=A0A7T5R2W9_9BACT|nr:MAG: hypothetical protein HYS17_01500 [Micavibrio aeruginosavorus]
MSGSYRFLNMSRLAQFFTVLALGGAVGVASVEYFLDNTPSLSVEGRRIKHDILERLANSGVRTDPFDDCAAHYIAHQQSERQTVRESFRQRASAEGVVEDEIARVIGADQAKDAPYALYVFMACRSGRKPEVFDPKMF